MIQKFKLITAKSARIKGIILLILILSLFLGSCVTQRRCNNKFPPISDTTRITIIRDSIVYKDTIIYIQLPAIVKKDSIIIPCPPPPLAYVPDTAYAETPFAKAKSWWSYPYIKLNLEQKKTTLELRLDSAIKEVYFWKSEYLRIKQTKVVKEIPRIYKTAMSICIFIFAVAFIFLGWKIKTFFKK